MGACTSTPEGNLRLAWDDLFSVEDPDEEEVQRVMDEVELDLCFEAMEDEAALERLQGLEERINALGK